MQNYIDFKVNGINSGLKPKNSIFSWDFEDFYKISNNEQMKIQWYDSLFGIETKPQIDVKEDFSKNLSYKYQPTNYSFIEYMFGKYPFSHFDHLYDFGVGYGRVIYMAAYFGCKCISGCELDKNYYDALLYSLKHNNHDFVASSSINIVNNDAKNVILDSSINKFFFFNPFHLKIYIKVFNNIVRSYAANKRNVMLFFYCPLKSTIKYINRFLDFKLLEKIDIDEEHVLFVVYQIK